MNVNYPIIDADGHVMEKDARAARLSRRALRQSAPVSRPILTFLRSMAGIAAPAFREKIRKPRRRAGSNFSMSWACKRRCFIPPAVCRWV